MQPNLKKIGVFLPKGCPLSMQIYFKKISQILSKNHDVEFVTFNRTQTIPKDVDLYWDPRSGGGQAPYRKLYSSNIPIAVTVHGLSLFSIPIKEQYFSKKEIVKAWFRKIRYSIEWTIWSKRLNKIITVSEYTRQDVIKHLNLPPYKVKAIWNGYDQNEFFPLEKKGTQKSYFLNVTSYQKKKNFERLLEAYQLLNEDTRPDLIAVVKPYNKQHNIKGLKIINEKLSFEEIIQLYQNAFALVFPSMHEGFGLPIIEAMASGIPVITSNVTSCPEVAGDAALLVNPRNTLEIKESMEKIIADADLRNELISKGLERAKTFSWEKSAEEHYMTFCDSIKKLS
jgi:glycosyltransferase involved in cell wall biosynthesis